MKLKAFEKEINMIKNKDLREDAQVLINTIPDYFFTVPASSSGKYHPQSSLGEGGLLRHTQTVVYFADEFSRNESMYGKLSERGRDLLIIAAIMHDSCKSGRPQSEHTLHEHPILAAELINESASLLKMSEQELNQVVTAVSSHMGQWTKRWSSDVVLPTPNNDFSRMLHMADYIASRKEVNVDIFH